MSTAVQYPPLENGVATLRRDPVAHQYLRVSKDKWGNEKSQDEQGDENTAQRTAYGWLAGITYRDTGSASRHRQSKKVRVGWAQLLADIDNPQVFRRGDILILWEASRGSRQLGEWITMLDLCLTRAVLIYVTTEDVLFDPNKPRDYDQLVDLGKSSRRESEIIRRRVLRHINPAAVAGKVHGPIAYGYERVYHPTTRKLECQRLKYPEAELVRGIFAKAAAGMSLNQITNELNAARVPSPQSGGEWCRQTVRRMLTRVTYLGQRSHTHTVTPADGGEPVKRTDITPAQWPALVEPDVFYAVQRILLDPKRKLTRPGRAVNLLTGIATCAALGKDGKPCGSTLGARRTMTNGSFGPAYWCKASGHIQINMDDMDQWVDEKFVAGLADPKRWKKLVSPPGNDQAVAADRAQLAVLQARLIETGQAAADGEMTMKMAGGIEAQVERDITAVQARLRKAETPPVLRGLLGPPSEGGYTVDDIATRWDAATVAGKRRILRELCVITVDRAPHGGCVRVNPDDRCTFGWVERGKGNG
jgi:site-specific DNA recombinase